MKGLPCNACHNVFKIDDNICPRCGVFNIGKGFRESYIYSEELNNVTFIGGIAEEYNNLLKIIDNDIEQFILSGKETKAILLSLGALDGIVKIHEILLYFYSLFYRQIYLLEKFNSDRYKSLENRLLPMVDLLENQTPPLLSKVHYVLKTLNDIGFASRAHWFISIQYTTEIEYMIDILRILIEPDFVPGGDNTQKEENLEKTDRYIPSLVKMAVWRRDGGKCVECKSKEKIEYDHIIPVNKGGSNTERNVQLLCEKCNREKSAKIM